MSSSKFYTIILIPLTLALILQTSFGGGPLYHVCYGSENFTSHSPYELNLNMLTHELIYMTPGRGFSVALVDQYQNQVYGLALCRSDVSTLKCNHCVSEASKKLRNLCPYNKGAIIWYDYCMFKYLDTDFFGNIDNTNTWCKGNKINVTDPATMYNKTTALLSQLSQNASVNPKLYATGQLKVEESETLYGLTQCTGDLSGPDCQKCLSEAIDDIPLCCYGQKGGMVGSGSCYFRFEIFPFFKE